MALTSLARLPPSMRAQLEAALKKGVDSLEGVDPMPSIGVPAAPREEPNPASRGCCKVTPLNDDDENENDDNGEGAGTPGGHTSNPAVEPTSKTEGEQNKGGTVRLSSMRGTDEAMAKYEVEELKKTSPAAESSGGGGMVELKTFRQQ